MTDIHVAPAGSEGADGSAARPFRTIGRAAEAAQPGDTVVVHAGEYREWVKPPRGGRSDRRRITYSAAPGEHVVIKGSEPVTGWERVLGSVWKAAVPNTLFGDFNPFAEEIAGDWMVRPEPGDREPPKHLGDVYLDGRSFYEAASLEEVEQGARRTEQVDDRTGVTEAIRDPDQTRRVWYAEVGEAETTVWANFQDADPHQHLVEINVRRSVFYPVRHHLDYITVRGFELAQAACPWTPPTADQPGLIGPNWAKGWIIEDNTIHDAKCSGISLGKEASTGDNFAAQRGDKPGYQYQLEAVFSARRIGWDEEHVGSHVVRRNTIFDCGQNGIVGHLGCVFSTIEDNHIHDIAVKREFYGHEIAGVKLHAAIDVRIEHNRIHDCTLGIWLDWQTQGTRVTRNLLYGNTRDLYVEVSHGPYLVDHNVFASRVSLEVWSQGGAYVNNLVGGSVSVQAIIERPTPYHVPHSTQVAGYAAILSGDDRYFGNLFLGGDITRAYGPEGRPEGAGYGTAAFDGHPDTMAEYLVLVNDPTKSDHERYRDVKQPVYLRDNVYGPGAAAYEREAGAIRLTGRTGASVVDEGEAVYLEVALPEGFDGSRRSPVGGRDLPPVRFVDAEFEERDGTPARIDTDLVGTRKSARDRYPAGPLASLSAGTARVRVW